MNAPPDISALNLNNRAMAALGLEVQPFTGRLGSEEYFSDPVIQMQLNMLQHNIKFSNMLQVLKGDAGCGKTALIVQMLANANDEFQIFIVRGKANLNAAQIISGMLKIFQRPVPDDPAECIQRLLKHLSLRLDKNLSSVLVIENTHLISASELNKLLAITDEINQALDGKLRLLLVAEPQIEAILTQLTSKQIREGKIFISNMRTLDQKRTGEYLTHKLQGAGYNEKLPFSKSQLQKIYSISGGIPKKIEETAVDILNRKYASKLTLAGKISLLMVGIPVVAVLVSIMVIVLVLTISPTTEQESVKVAELATPAPQPQPIAKTIATPATTNKSTTEANNGASFARSHAVDYDNNETRDAIQQQPNVAAKDVDGLTVMQPPTTDLPNATAAQALPAPVLIPTRTITPKSVVVAAASIPATDEAAQATKAPQAARQETTLTHLQSATQDNEGATAIQAELTESERWLLEQNPKRYVIQLLASYSLSEIEQFKQATGIADKAALFETVHQSQPWYSLTYGLYADDLVAREVIRTLPERLKKNTPWVRSIGSVQQAINKRLTQ